MSELTKYNPPTTLRVRNWEKWQSYRRDRAQPPWIKVYRRLLMDPAWASLTDAQKGQLTCLWLLAADRDGELPADPKLLQKLCGLDFEPEIEVFISHGFIVACRQGDAKMASSGRQGDAKMASQIQRQRQKQRQSNLTASPVSSLSNPETALSSSSARAREALAPTTPEESEREDRASLAWDPEEAVEQACRKHLDWQPSAGQRFRWARTMWQNCEDEADFASTIDEFFRRVGEAEPKSRIGFIESRLDHPKQWIEEQRANDPEARREREMKLNLEAAAELRRQGLIP